MKTEEQQTSLGYMLAGKLHDATAKFVREHRAINIDGIIGAANVYLASQFTTAPSKQEALDNLERDFDIVRGLIEVTPDAMFGHEKPGLN